MLRTILGAACGFLVGGGLGVGIAFLMYLNERPELESLYLSAAISQGFLGACFGAVVGSIVGATGAILRSLKLHFPPDPPPPPRGDSAV